MAEVARLVIVMDQGGGCQVAGPLDNRALCYSMLEMARDAIRDHADAARRGQSGLVLAGPGAVPPAPDANGKNRLPTG